MTLKQALTLARERLAAVKYVDNPSLESEVLLRHVLHLTRTQLHLDLDQRLDPEKLTLFQQMVERHVHGEPVAYIIQCREFFGLDFYVDQRVLIPRPETELLVEEGINFVKAQDGKTPLIIADIGTGSGAIAISLSLQGVPLQEIYATDISTSALEIADLNCKKHKVNDRITLLQGDLLEPLPGPVDLLIANLPYVSQSDLAQMPSARYEPVLALDGGESGLDQIFRLSCQLKAKINPGGCILLEIGLGQSQAVTNLLRSIFPSASIETKPDLAGIERAVKVILPD